MKPATLTYYGYPARKVCNRLADYPQPVRTLHAIDALVTAVAFLRMDTLSVLLSIGTPVDQKGMFGITVMDATRRQTTLGNKLVESFFSCPFL